MTIETKIEQKTHKVFISYCWTSKEHEEWVHNLAERLMSNGIEVKYDKWDLQKGQDKYSFMESMVQDETIEKVLVICDKGYKEKSDKREGGVGTEVQIITPELYDKVNQTKFVPIIVEQGDSFDSYMPIFIKSRIGIDMSCIEKYEEGYDELIRLIYDKPKFTKPKLGTMPSYLDEKPQYTFKTQQIISSIKNCILKNAESSNYYINEFIPEFINTLNDYKIEYSDLKEPYDEIIYNKIVEMLPLRDHYIEFIDIICKLNKLNIDKIINFFEKIYSFTEFQGVGHSWEGQFDHYKFLIMEIFIYTVIILLKNEKYQELNILVNSPYFIFKRGHQDENHSSFLNFRFNIDSLEVRNKRLNLNKISFTAQLLIDRSVSNGENYKKRLVDADLLLHYIDSLNKANIFDTWFPTTYVYLKMGEKTDILKRLISKRYFEKVKELLGVNSIIELKDRINNIDERDAQYMKYSNCWDKVPSIKWQINPDDIGTLP